MEFELKRYQVIIVNTNKEYVTYGLCIDEKLFDDYQEAYTYLKNLTEKYKDVKLVKELSRDEIYIEFEDYFIQAKLSVISNKILITSK